MMLHSINGFVQADTQCLVHLVTRIILLHLIIIVIMDGFFLEHHVPIPTMHYVQSIIHALQVGHLVVHHVILPMTQLVTRITHVHLEGH